MSREVRVLPWVAAKFAEWEAVAIAGDLHAKALAATTELSSEAERITNRPPGPAPSPPRQIELTPGMMNGSQAKTAFALRLNCENLIAGHARRKLVEIPLASGEKQKAWQVEGPADNLNCTGFLTLTLGDWRRDLTGKNRFEKIYDAAEASRRINNLNRRVLSVIFSRAIVVTERHKDGGIHFHIVGVLRSRADIRTGFDFPAFKEIRKSGRKFSAPDVGASPELAALWKMLRKKLPGYGFGRAELTPIEKTGEAVACYVSKYIEKNVCNRLKDDRGKKLVRYIGWDGGQLKPNDFSWATPRAAAWRAKTRECCELIGCDTREAAKEAMGPRWAWHVSNLWRAFSDQVTPFIVWPDNYFTKAFIREELGKIAGRGHCENVQKPRQFVICGEIYTAREAREAGLSELWRN